MPKERKYHHVIATHEGALIRISARDIDDSLEIPVIPDLPAHRATPRFREQEESRELIAEQLAQQRSTSMSKYLTELPTPLYVPLERRWSESHEGPSSVRRLRRHRSDDHLPISEALRFADEARRREQYETESLNYDLRNKLLESLFELPASTDLADRITLLPLDQLQHHRQTINSALTSLGVPEPVSKTKKLFDVLDDTVAKLQGKDLSNIRPEDDHYATWVDWVIHGSPLADRVNHLLPLINQYETDRLSITEPSRSFLNSINTFLADSGKCLEFSKHGALTVTLPNGNSTSAANLSSGELQLLTFFTFLYFRFDRDVEFPILIDEPELSLHLAWQANYLEAVTGANPNAQFIVATHSPEIAGRFEDRLIDISP